MLCFSDSNAKFADHELHHLEKRLLHHPIRCSVFHQPCNLIESTEHSQWPSTRAEVASRKLTDERATPVCNFPDSPERKAGSRWVCTCFSSSSGGLFPWENPAWPESSSLEANNRSKSFTSSNSRYSPAVRFRNLPSTKLASA